MVELRYRENHYVSRWYQERFLPDAGEMKFCHLDLNPDKFTDSLGNIRTKKSLHRWGTDSCLKQTDLYTTQYGRFESTDIERFFFGKIDNSGKAAIEAFAKFSHPNADNSRPNLPTEHFDDLLVFMSTQKLRTPKGLRYLSSITKSSDKNSNLMNLQKLQQLHCAIWTEAVWVIAEVPDPSTGFIMSDHPVTVFNEDIYPGSLSCKEYGDPDVWLMGTHTIFPLDKSKALFLTNLAWVRDPYANGKKFRPNPDPFRQAIFNFEEIQTGRKLSSLEVHKINYTPLTPESENPWAR